MKHTETQVMLSLVTSFLFIALAIPGFAWANTTPKLTVSTTNATEGSTTQDNEAFSSTASIKPEISYRTKMSAGTWSNWHKNGSLSGSAKQNQKMKALQIKTADPLTGSVQYQIHAASAGWMPVKSDGSTATASKNAINAIRIKLTNELSKTYSIVYQVNTQQSGWQEWKRDGSIAGSTNDKVAVRAIRIKLERKATTSKAPGKGLIGARYRTKTQGLNWGKWMTQNKIAGTTGKSLRMQALSVTLYSGIYQGSIKYRAHLSSGKWTHWKSNGAQLGPTNRIDALQIKLTGSISKEYDVVYQAHIENIGWQRRMRNGETAGLEGHGLRVEAIRINVVAKSKASGWFGSGTNWSYYQSGKQLINSWLVTDESPIEPTNTGLQRYWIDATGKLAVNRYINPKSTLDSNAGWTAFATSQGYLARGKYVNGDGILLANPIDGKLKTQSRWLTTSTFDGSKQTYRLVKKGPATVVKTGLFKVNGKKYYAWQDGRGYIMKSTMNWVDGTWYKANSKGVLKTSRSLITKAIENYVKWAIAIANDNSHGYSQATRWGPDYDCSSLVCASLLAVGFPNSGATYTGNMKARLTKIGFVWHEGTAGLRRGDILLVHASWRQHTEIYIGNNKLVGAHIAETGGIYGKAGDQTGNEISVRKYYDAPWQGYLRYKG